MSTILTFDVSRCRRGPAEPAHAADGPARVLIFTGVRREPLHPRPPRHPEPMFEDPLPSHSLPGDRRQSAPRYREPLLKDPAPDKPGGRKPRRGKTG